MKDCKACVGCRDNFYNGNNSLGVKQCWSLPKAKIITRYRIGRDVPMNIKEAYVKERLPDCYHAQGYAFLSSIPHYAKDRAGRELEARRDAARQARQETQEPASAQPATVATNYDF